MTRRVLTLIAIALLTTIVGAQQPRSLSSADRGKLYAMNQSVIEKLVDRTVEASRSPNDHLKRADSYFRVLQEFSGQIKRAQEQGDSERVTELTGHLTVLVDRGLAPTLIKAKHQVEGGSGQDEFPGVRNNLVAQLNALLKILDEPNSRASLEGAKSKVYAITIPPMK